MKKKQRKMFYEKHLPKSNRDSVIRRLLVILIMRTIYRRRIFVDRINKEIDKYYKNNPQSDLKRKFLFNDILYCVYIFGINSDEYFYFRLYEKNFRGKKEYFTLGNNMKRLCAFYNKQEDIHFLDNKIDTYGVLGDYFKRDMIKVCEEKACDDFEKFCQKHSCCIKKPIAGGCGRG